MLIPIEQELKNKTVFVMGGSSGMGMASAELLARRGASVTIFGHARDTIEIAAGFCAAGLQVHGIMGDGSQSEIVDSAIAETVEMFGGLDILVHTAAIHPLGNAVETDEATWDRTMAVNLKSMYLLAHYGIPELIKRGGGSVVNFSSVQATANTPGVCAYATTKGAIISFTHTLAIDFSKHNIRANTVCPGSIYTPMQEMFTAEAAKVSGYTYEEQDKIQARPVPLQRHGQAVEVAEMVSFLVGPRGTYCNGAQFTVDGGLLAGLRLS